MAGINSFDAPKGLPSELDSLPESKLHKKQVISKSLGVDFDNIESESNDSDTNNS